MITGALILFIGLVLGWCLRPMLGAPSQPRQPKPLETVCGCTHHLSVHNLKTGLCSGETRRGRKLSAHGDMLEWDYVTCPCKHYVGPEPLPQYVAPEISDNG